MGKIGKVSVLVLSWNGRKHLETCLPALARQEDPGCDWEVVVLDNGSRDGTAGWVRRHHPEVRLIESKTNLGFCAGTNRLAREAAGDALALLNNDTRPRRGWLRALVAAYDDAPDDVAAVSGRIVDWDGERLDFARGVMTFDGHAFQQDYGRPLEAVELPDDGAELLFACGGNMLIRRSSFERAGGFDERFFAYLEDVDLGWRLWAGGERVVYAGRAVVHHRSMATSQLLGNENRGFLFERNAFLTMDKNLDAELWNALMPAVMLTLIHRTQTLLVQNNLGGELLTLDPYAGYIADTELPEPEAEGTDSAAAAPGLPRLGLREKWAAYGTRELVRRGLRKAVRAALPGWLLEIEPGAPRLTDARTVAQLRALTQIVAPIDRSAARRRQVQARRRRADREIFERFPLWVVPTYPGDDKLFASPGFETWLPDDLPLVRATLDEVMALRE